MLNKDKIENFAFNCDRPFSAQEAADLCNVSLKKAGLFVKQLRDEGKIEIQRKVRNKYFYIWKRKPKKKSSVSISITPETADKIEKIITEKGYTSLRDIAIQAGCSYESVRLVIVDRGLANVNVEKEHKKQMKAVGKDILNVLRTGKKVVKKQRQSVFMESIIPYAARG